MLRNEGNFMDNNTANMQEVMRHSQFS